MTTSSPLEQEITASAYVRHAIDRLTKVTREPGQDSIIWNYVHLLVIVSTLELRGYGDAIRAAADEQARAYGLPPRAEVEKAASA